MVGNKKTLPTLRSLIQPALKSPVSWTWGYIEMVGFAVALPYARSGSLISEKPKSHDIQYNLVGNNVAHPTRLDFRKTKILRYIIYLATTLPTLPGLGHPPTLRSFDS